MGQLKPLVISERDVARDSWDDTAKGVLGFRTLFSGGTTATRALTAGIADLNAGGWLGLHRHMPAEIYYIIEGRGTVTLDGPLHLIQPQHRPRGRGGRQRDHLPGPGRMH